MSPIGSILVENGSFSSVGTQHQTAASCCHKILVALEFALIFHYLQRKAASFGGNDRYFNMQCTQRSSILILQDAVLLAVPVREQTAAPRAPSPGHPGGLDMS